MRQQQQADFEDAQDMKSQEKSLKTCRRLTIVVSNADSMKNRINNIRGPPVQTCMCAKTVATSIGVDARR